MDSSVLMVTWSTYIVFLSLYCFALWRLTIFLLLSCTYYVYMVIQFFIFFHKRMIFVPFKLSLFHYHFVSQEEIYFILTLIEICMDYWCESFLVVLSFICGTLEHFCSLTRSCSFLSLVPLKKRGGIPLGDWFEMRFPLFICECLLYCCKVSFDLIRIVVWLSCWYLDDFGSRLGDCDFYSYLYIEVGDPIT